MDSELIEKLSIVSKSLFNLGIFSIGAGSISARVEMSRFVIDKKESILDNMSEENFILLNHARDYRWNDASVDAEIHSLIYQNIDDAKFIAFSMSPFLIAHTLVHPFIEPVDFMGKTQFDSIKIYDPKDFSDWLYRAPSELLRVFEESGLNFVVVKGYGVVAHAREIEELATLLVAIENSCKILHLANATRAS